MMNNLKVLIVDDESELRKSVSSILLSTLQDVAFVIEEAENGKVAFEKIQAQDFDLVLMDVKMPEWNGIETLVAIKEYDPRIFVVLMTAHSNVQDAILAIKEGAYDYFEKPINPQKLVEVVRKCLEAREMVSNLALSNPIFDDDVESEFVGGSSKMKEVFNLIYKLCKVDTTVIVRGENGTGKELVAKAIHFNSPRKSGSFVAINCGAIPENLMESELFGHEKGAFTGAIERKIGKFQLANNGTLFLDEIGELKPDMQVKLLRVLQEKKFVPVGSNREIKTNTRIIAATNRNLEKMIEDNQFREDLFYRLNVMPIYLPPLRERADDIPALVQYFIRKFTKLHDSPIQGASQQFLDLLKKYRWPGNIRELENIIERAFILESNSMITEKSLPDLILNVEQEESEKSEAESNLSALDFDVFKEQAEKEFIISALKANKGKINQTVAQANIPKNTLLRKIKKYNTQVKDYIS
jgi:DNA-binding NtrC family response regulator